MSVSSTDIKFYATTNIPTADTGTLGGAIDTANEITDDQTGKLIVLPYANPDGGADKPYYGKIHVKNTNATDDLTTATIYIANLLQDPPSTGVIGITTVATGDDDTKYVRVYFENAVGTPTYEDVVLPSTPGTTYTTGQALLNRRIAVGLHLVSDDTITTASGDITIARGTTTLGIIPEGGYNATGRIDIGLASTLDDTATTTNRVTAPGGITFSRADSDNPLDVANSGVLTHAKNQAVWIRLTMQDGATPIEYDYLMPKISGLTA